MRFKCFFHFFILFFLVSTLSFAGDMTPANPPASTDSYTLEDIWNRLNDGTDGAMKQFTEPVTAPSSTGKDLNDVMDKAPARDDANGAVPGEVANGKKFWGLNVLDGTWGLQTGSLTTQTVDNSTVNQLAGNYGVFDLSAVDTDLATANIKSGTTIFGVAGDSNVVNTSTGNAVAADIATGKKAWVDGSEITGTGTIATYPAPVPKTGQTKCYDAYSEQPCPVAGFPGQDGDNQAGTALPNPRFTTNGDTTVTDNLTGLIWGPDANLMPTRDAGYDADSTDDGRVYWGTALNYMEKLNTESYLGFNDWRLPNVKELQSLIDCGQVSPALPSGHPFTNVQSHLYWSSTTYASDAHYVWIFDMNFCGMHSTGKTGTIYVWPVRGGQ